MPARARPSSAVHWIDLDRFKAVNDTLGHPGRRRPAQGGRRAAAAGRRAKAIVDRPFRRRRVRRAAIADPQDRRCDAPRPPHHGGARSRPFQVDGHQVDIGASIGIALAPRDGLDADRLLKSADLALYRAKADGRGAFRFFEIDMDAGAQARRALELDLREAWERGEFDIHYQPLVDLLSRAHRRAARRWCAGTIRSVAWSRRWSSSRSPRRPASSFRSANGCCSRPARRRRTGRATCGLPSTCRRSSSSIATSPRPSSAALAKSGLAGEPPGTRDHRDGAAARDGADRLDDGAAAPARRAPVARRFRHRLFVAELSAEVPVPEDQARPLLREGSWARRRLGRDRARRRRASAPISA